MKDDIPAVLIVGACGIGSTEILRHLANENIKAEIILVGDDKPEEFELDHLLGSFELKPISTEFPFIDKQKNNFEPHYRKKRGRRKKR